MSDSPTFLTCLITHKNQSFPFPRNPLLSISSQNNLTMAYSFSLQDFNLVNDDDVRELESFNISKLVTYLKSSFRKESFKNVEKILSLREEKLKLEKKEVIERAEGLEEELKDYKDRCSKLLIRFGKLESAKAELEVDFKETVKRLEEDCNVLRELEGRATERIRSLSSELDNVSKEKNKELIVLKAKIKEAECAKWEVDNELDTQKRKYKELEKEHDAQKLRYSRLVNQVSNLEKSVADFDSQSEVNEVSGKERKIDETNGGENRACSSMLNMKENTLRHDERVLHSVADDSVRHSLAEASGSGQAEGPPTVNLLSKPLANQKEERKCPSSPKLVSGRSTQENVIEIRDSESENEATVAEKLPKNRVIKTSLSQKDIENGSSHREKCASVSSRKRRRMVVSSDSEDDDRIPIGKLKMKKFEEVHLHSDSNINDRAKINAGMTKFLSHLRTWKPNGLNWQYEVQMVSSFDKDPSVCMRAVCALYRQHTLEKKTVAASGHSINRGFCRIDEQRGTFLAEFLLGGKQDGDMKKSVEELKRYCPTGIDDCQKLAKKYSQQLFTIYRNKEDAFFRL